MPIIIFLLMMAHLGFALEVDEKLTVRILRTSESRKTLMLNRGIEDGLAEGDHAKFIVSAGIVARGQAVKVSPTRSVWSIYRLVNADYISKDTVMTIKITPPVKTTLDDTKNLVQEDTPTEISRPGGAKELGIPLAPGADDLKKEAEDMAELSSVRSETSTPQVIPEKNREFFWVAQISSLSAKTSSNLGGGSFSNSQSYHHLGLGGEFYTQNEREWYSPFSLLGSLNLMRSSNQGYNGSFSSNDVTEFYVGTNWHISTLPSATLEFIPFLHLGIHYGSVKSSYKTGSEASAVENLSANGSTSGYALGFGYKFFTPNGFGARILADYYVRSEVYKADEFGEKFTKVVRGPRLMVGLSYRF